MPHLISIATAVPRHLMEQTAVAERARRVFGLDDDGMARLRAVYANSGIRRRFSCVPLDWYGQPVGWRERNRLFVDHAVPLIEQAAGRALDRAGLAAHQLDGVVAVSTTGIATPSLDALLMQRMGLRRDVMRLPIFGLGCAGGVIGLARAAAMAAAHPGRRFLMVVVELCGLTFRARDLSQSNVIATALFGDGAAAAVVSTEGEGPRITGWGEHTWPDSLDVMGWLVADDGLGVLFSRDIPSLVRTHFRPALDAFLAGRGLTLADIGHFLCHPGGAKVVAALERALDLDAGTLATERAVLRDFGNMSAATLLFVMERALPRPPHGRVLATALGPGFTAGFLVLE